jgi:hypothetical protein
MNSLVILFFILFSATTSFAAEGYSPSHEKNVVMLRGNTNGGTAFILNDPTWEQVLVTQEHVLEVTGDSPTLQWGHVVGPLFQLHQEEAEAYEFVFQADAIWRDKELDVAILKMPEDLKNHCNCNGLDPAVPVDGSASLIGYPITERRIWPRTSGIVRAWKEFWGKVRQQVSIGKIWRTPDEYLGDMDAISGNSGGPIIQNEKVVGTLHLLKTWKGVGYRYENPSLNFLPISVIIDKLRELKY